MTPRRKRKEFGFAYILLGLVLGFFIGSGIVYWYTSRDEGANLFGNAWNYLGSLFEPSATDEQLSAEMETAMEESSGRNVGRTRQPGTGTPISPQNDLQPDTALTIHEELPPDTLLIADPASLQNIEATYNGASESIRDRGQMRVAQERLIHIRAFSKDPGNYNPVQSNAVRMLDSLLGGAAQSRLAENVIIVEFWISPLNARGYILEQNKLVVFGLSEHQHFGLETDGNRLYVRYEGTYYAITTKNDFSPFVPSDPAETVALQQRWP